ncbi:MAG: hypothetical protein ACLFUR_00965 [Candidatus Hadarchaeia archaeon]
MVRMKETSFFGWDKCLWISNGVVDLVTTLEVGPRIIFFGFSDQNRNEFAVNHDEAGSTGGDDWKLYGGHRLWHAPEDEERTYIPDNRPVEYERIENGARFLPSIEEKSHIKKEIEVRMDPSSPEVEVNHILINRGLWEIELAPWAITVLSSGGKAIIPVSRSDPDNLLPDRLLSFWPYSRIGDERIRLENEFIFLHQREEAEMPTKLGSKVSDEWAAYFNNDHLFVKRFEFDEQGVYPDNGCNVEAYTDEFMLELETLGTLESVEPGGKIEHREIWDLYDGVTEPEDGKEAKEILMDLVDSKNRL